ncbi:MAG: carboxymuconolactone decarboxylase family protein, partial [Candidatus Dadabacteria bacterium]
MTRIPRRSPRGAGLLVRAVYRAVRRRFGRVPASVQLMAHNGWVLAAASAFELAFGRARALDARLKELASLKAATVVGCRFCIDIGTALARSTG